MKKKIFNVAEEFKFYEALKIAEKTIAFHEAKMNEAIDLRSRILRKIEIFKPEK
jgi:hypothetical protein